MRTRRWKNIRDLSFNRQQLDYDKYGNYLVDVGTDNFIINNYHSDLSADPMYSDLPYVSTIEAPLTRHRH